MAGEMSSGVPSTGVSLTRPPGRGRTRHRSCRLRSTLHAMNLLDDLAGFLQEHKRCGLLDSEVTPGDGECRVTFACDCGAQMSRVVAAEPLARA